MTYLTSTLGALALSALAALTFIACDGSGGVLTPRAQIARFCDDTVAPTCEAPIAGYAPPTSPTLSGKIPRTPAIPSTPSWARSPRVAMCGATMAI